MSIFGKIYSIDEFPWAQTYDVKYKRGWSYTDLEDEYYYPSIADGDEDEYDFY